jgi:hypothetical protein
MLIFNLITSSILDLMTDNSHIRRGRPPNIDIVDSTPQLNRSKATTNNTIKLYPSSIPKQRNPRLLKVILLLIKILISKKNLVIS